MNEEIKRLLYTTKDGRWYWETDYAADHLELDDEDIDFDRIPKLHKLLTPGAVKADLKVPLEAALVLTSWGDGKGLEYLEYVEHLCPEDWYGSGYSHRFGGFDTTREWMLNAISFYSGAHLERAGSDVKRERIFPLVSSILKDSETQQFQFNFLSTILKRSYREYDVGLKSYLRAMLDDDSGFHHHKPADAVKFFEEYDPDYLDEALAAAGKTLSDYQS